MEEKEIKLMSFELDWIKRIFPFFLFLSIVGFSTGLVSFIMMLIIISGC
jgi:hypothetical protein